MWDDPFADLIRSRLTHLPPGEPLDPDADLRALGLDSLSTIKLVTGLEDAYGFTFPDEALEWATFATPRALWHVVAQNRTSAATR
jgi:acyl carrier protein